MTDYPIYHVRMNMSAFEKLTSALSSLAARRTIIIVCALAFVFVNMAHSVSHLSMPQSAAIVQIDVDSSADKSSPPNKMPAVEHCLACSVIVAVPMPELSLVWSDNFIRVPWRAPTDIVPYILGTETPPPRVSI